MDDFSLQPVPSGKGTIEQSMDGRPTALLVEIEPGDSANQSMLGEEDPGAAVDSVSWSCNDVLFAIGAPAEAPRPAASSESSGREASVRRRELKKSLARWENEGGGDGQQPFHGATSAGRTDVALTNAELVQLQIRVIALEGLVTALLAGAPEEVSTLARELAVSIFPRAGCTPHHLTIHASSQMVHLAQRAELLSSDRDPPTKAGPR